VIEWIDAQPMETLFLSAITVAELRAGVALLPAGKRRTCARHLPSTGIMPGFWFTFFVALFVWRLDRAVANP